MHDRWKGLDVRLLSNTRSAVALTTVLAVGAIVFAARSPAHGYGSARSGETVAATTNRSAGGLSVSPGIFEHPAGRGFLGMVRIFNTTAGAMTIKVALRPWLQSRSGEVSPNRRATLGDVAEGPRSFTLGSGATRTVGLSLSRTPSQRSLYGAIEVTGLPRGRGSQGLRFGYRVVTSLRLDPPKTAQAFRARAGGLVEQGSARHGTLLLAVRNTGNTIVPIGGTALISGLGRSLRATAGARAIVPGQTVNVPIAELLGALPAGRYTVTVRLSQGGRGIETVTRAIKLR
jgi:hypothetical protein